MSFDLFQSRRNFNEKCRWWSRNESDKYDESELIYKRIPSGTFCAKEVNAEVKDDNVINGIFMVSRTQVTIESPDNLSGIKNEDIVEYQGDLWRVANLQKKKSRIQNTEFSKVEEISHFWYLSLIKD